MKLKLLIVPFSVANNFHVIITVSLSLPSSPCPSRKKMWGEEGRSNISQIITCGLFGKP